MLAQLWVKNYNVSRYATNNAKERYKIGEVVTDGDYDDEYVCTTNNRYGYGDEYDQVLIPKRKKTIKARRKR